MILGTRLRHVHGPNLLELEALIESFPFKIEHKQTLQSRSGEWYIHFTIADEVVFRAQNEAGVVSAEEAPKNKTIKNRGSK